MALKRIRRQQKDIDKARHRLSSWAMGSPSGVDGIVHTVSQLVEAAANFTGLQRSDAEAALAHEPFITATRILALNLWLTGDNSADTSNTPLAGYIKDRAKRESSIGRRWLQQLAQSHYEIRDVIHITPGTSLRLGPSSSGNTSITVHETRLADPQTLGLALFARVLPMPAGAVVSDGILMVERSGVDVLPSDATPYDVFAIWAAGMFAAEGLLTGLQLQSPHSALQSRKSPDATIDSPHGEGQSRATLRKGPSEQPAEPPAEPWQEPPPQNAETREKLLTRIRKLFAMAQETEASPLEAEIALRRCQSLMTKFGITEKDLETSEFGRQNAHASKRTPVHIKFLSIAVAKLNGVLFVTGGGPAHFRGYEIDVQVARLTLDYLSNAVERALTTRRRTGEFPAGRMAAYDYRLAFAQEVIQRVNTIISERETEEQTNSPTGSALMVRKLQIVRRECGQGLSRSSVRGRGAIDEKAAGAGREDGSRVSLDPQVARSDAPHLLGSE